MTFNKWIEKNGGITATARIIGVSPERIHNWLRRSCSPDALIMRRIVKVSKGVVDYETIILETTSKERLARHA